MLALVAIQYDIVADRRLAFKETFVFMDEDLTGADFAMQVRLTPDAAGTPFVDLATVTDGSEGIRLLYAGSATISAHIAAGRLDTDILKETNPATGAKYALTDTVTLSQLQVYIGKPSLQPPGTGLIPLPQELGDDTICAYDLIVTRSGGIDVKEFYGAFTVRGTATY